MPEACRDKVRTERSATSRIHRRTHLVFFFVFEAETRGSSLKTFPVVRPGLVGFKLHHLYHQVRSQENVKKKKKGAVKRKSGLRR